MLGLVSAMKEECEAILQVLEGAVTTTTAKRDFVQGTLHGVPVIVVFSRWGKVAAATTATILLSQFKVSHVLFTGVAGGVAPQVRQGDIVLGSKVVYHDLDPRPLFKWGEVPLLDVTSFLPDHAMLAALQHAASSSRVHSVGLGAVHVGTIATGDEFISSRARVDQVVANIRDVLCVEMEGAAIAQVCYEWNTPFALARIISDDASHTAPLDFVEFVNTRAAPGGLALVSGFVDAFCKHD